MTIHGPRPVTPPLPGAGGAIAPRPAGARVSPPTPGPAAPPDGADPLLWSVLTTDERSFFTARAVAGPLTYGPAEGPGVTADAPRGQRVDVRV